MALDLGGESWSARTWQGPGRAAAPAPAPGLTGIISQVVFITHTENWDLADTRPQKSGVRSASQAVMAWAQHCWGRAEQRGSSGQCHGTGTPSGPGAVGTPRWPRGTERVCRAVLAVPLICPNPVCTRGGASPAWPQGDTGEKCSVAEPAPRGTAWLGVPTAARLTGMGCPRPAATLCQDGVEPRAKHPACQDG